MENNNTAKNSKVQTFLGFAIKARKYRVGLNTIATLKNVNLLVICKTISENSKKEAEKLAKKFKCPLLETKDVMLSELIHIEDTKIMAITDKNLANAVIENSEKDFIIIC